jgi:glycosyltransferase involved in cell wall biosynthesis
MLSDTPRVAVLIPCYNEAATVAGVVADFRRSLPDAEIFVCDKDSSDGTGSLALQAGAHVCREMLRGKGNVVRRMFSDVEADLYVLVDGDGTSDANATAYWALL